MRNTEPMPGLTRLEILRAVILNRNIYVDICIYTYTKRALLMDIDIICIYIYIYTSVYPSMYIDVKYVGAWSRA